MTTYPDTRLWNLDAQELVIINPEDLRVDKTLSRLDLRGNELVKPTSDGGEILRRQRLLKYVTAKDRGWLRALFRGNSLLLSGGLPTKHWQFLNHFLPKSHESHFMLKLTEFLDCMQEGGELPEQLGDLCSSIRGHMDRIRAAEQRLFSLMSTEITRSVKLHGTVTFNCQQGNVRVIESNVCGHQLFVHDRFADRKWGSAEWVENRIPSLFGLRFLHNKARELQNAYWDKLEYGPYVIEKLPEAFEETMCEFLDVMFRENRIFTDDRGGFHIQLYFSFEGRGLKVMITGLEMYRDKKRISRRKSTRGHREYVPDRFPGYSGQHLQKVAKLDRDLLRNGSIFSEELQKKLVLLRDIRRVFGDESNEHVIENIHRITADFGVRSLFDVCSENPQLNDLWNEIEEFRAWVVGHIRTIRDICQIADALLKREKEWGLKTSFPTVLDDSAHSVSFNELVPINLIGRNKDGSGTDVMSAKDLVSVKGVPELNGKIVSLTGLNVAGKTVMLEELAEQLYLAHCGLMVFGANFAFNPKEALALVFIERGDGSTAELLGRKLVNVLRAAEKYPSHRFLVVIDELGTGTRESAGIKIGNGVLEKLKASGCSVIFSTQIPELAEGARDNLGAITFRMDDAYEIHPGIGAGTYEHLAHKTGLDEYIQ